MSPRKNPPLLTRSPLTGRVYIVTRYRLVDSTIVASEKFDVTEQFDALVAVALRDKANEAPRKGGNIRW